MKNLGLSRSGALTAGTRIVFGVMESDGKLIFMDFPVNLRYLWRRNFFME